MTTKKATQVMDIAKPGTLKGGSSTARPVLVTNRVVIQDPMVTPSADLPEKAEEAEKSSNPAKTDKLVIKPLSDPEPKPTEPIAAAPEAEAATEIAAANKEGLLSITLDKDSDGVVDKDEKAAAPAESTSDKPAADEKEKESTDETVAEEDQPELTDDEKSATEKSDKDKKTAQEQVDTKADEELAKLIEEKTYFLPIDAAVHRRSRIVAIVGTLVILLLALAWVNIALDAGFITIPGVEPLTRFFSS